MSIVPEKGTAVVTLHGLDGAETVVTCKGCWIKQSGGGLVSIGGVFVQQAEKTIIKVPNHALNPSESSSSSSSSSSSASSSSSSSSSTIPTGSREIRTGDTIVFDGTTYNVTAVGGGLRTVRTVWDCEVQKVFN